MKKRINWMSIILMVISIASIVGLIYFAFFSGSSATVISRDTVVSGDKITLKHKILSYQEEYDGEIVTVRGYMVYDQYVDMHIRNENDTKQVVQYSFTVKRGEWDWYGNDYGYKVSLDKTTMDEAFVDYLITKDIVTADSTGLVSEEQISLSKYFSLVSEFNGDRYTVSSNVGVVSWTTKYGSKLAPTIYRQSMFETMLPTILVIGLVLIVVFFLFRWMNKSASNSNKQAIDFNTSRARRVQASNVKFTDVAGCDSEKAEMEEMVDYLKQPSKYASAGAKLPKGILLVGPPGTGKTLLAKATAGEAGVPFFSISGSDFVEMFVGVGAGRVRDMFKTAKQNAPCIVFIDEIDAVGRQRGAGLGGGNDEREQTLNQLLVELDGFADNSGIIVMAATNRDDILDPALLRAGRFDRKVTVTLPDLGGRTAIFKVHARGKNIDPNVDFTNLAKRTVGFSGADIASVLNDAAILSVRNKTPYITVEEIDEAIDRRISGPAKSSRAFSEKERKQIAYHEAGHAIIGLTLEDANKVQKITIVPRGNTGGHVLMTPEHDRFLMTKNELFATITGYLGGRSSEEIFFNDVTTGASNDIEVATRIARAMVVEYGMSDLGPIQYENVNGSVFLGRDYTNPQKNFSSEIAKEIDREIRKIIFECHESARKIINEKKDLVTLIAETLLERETINAEQIDYLLEHKTLEGFNAPKKQVVLEEESSEIAKEESNEEVVEKSAKEIDNDNQNSEE